MKKMTMRGPERRSQTRENRQGLSESPCSLEFVPLVSPSFEDAALSMCVCARARVCVCVCVCGERERARARERERERERESVCVVCVLCVCLCVCICKTLIDYLF
jgi:hypothetical protein